MINREVVKFYVKQLVNSQVWKEYESHNDLGVMTGTYTNSLNTQIIVDNKSYTLNTRYHANGKDIVAKVNNISFDFNHDEVFIKPKAQKAVKTKSETKETAKSKKKATAKKTAK